MRISTIVFDMLIPDVYFPGYKVTKPYYCSVSYEYSEEFGTHKLLFVAFAGNTLSYLSIDSKFYSDVKKAILYNIESNKSMEQEIKAVSDEAYESYKRAVSY